MHRTTHLGSAGRWSWLALVGCTIASLLVGCGVGRQAVEDVVEHESIGDFLDVPEPLPPGEPGSIIRSRPLLGAPDGARAWRVLYRSTDLAGAPIAVSGIVVAPDGPGPAGGRPVVAWAHPTTGASGRCAPSTGVDPFVLVEGLHELLAAGYVVAATDYSGMGAAGPPSYLIGGTEGRNVLDSVRAAQHLDGAHAGDRTMLWGHSQGGHASLFAAQLAPGYAPELDLVGVAVAAPAADLSGLIAADIGDVSGVTIGAYAFDAFEEVYRPRHPGLSLTSILTPDAAEAVAEMASLCLFGQNKELHRLAAPLVGHFLAGDPSSVEPWATFLEENTPGGAPIGVPILVTQGDDDALVKPETTAATVARLCRQGEDVQYRTYRDVTHATVAYRSLPLLLGWLRDRLDAEPSHPTCR